MNLTRYFATLWGPHGVRVNALSPGGVAGGQDEEFVRKLPARVPLGRMAEPHDLRGPLLFLSSDASRYVTGVELRVDGGFTPGSRATAEARTELRPPADPQLHRRRRAAGRRRPLREALARERPAAGRGRALAGRDVEAAVAAARCAQPDWAAAPSPSGATVLRASRC